MGLLGRAASRASSSNVPAPHCRVSQCASFLSSLERGSAPSSCFERLHIGASRIVASSKWDAQMIGHTAHRWILRPCGRGISSGFVFDLAGNLEAESDWFVLPRLARHCGSAFNRPGGKHRSPYQRPVLEGQAARAFDHHGVRYRMRSTIAQKADCASRLRGRRTRGE